MWKILRQLNVNLPYDPALPWHSLKDLTPSSYPAVIDSSNQNDLITLKVL